MVFVVDHTLMIVSSAHGVPSSSIVPPQMSTTVWPSCTMHTEAPTSAPRSRLAESTSATEAKRSSKVPWMSAIRGTYPARGDQPAGGSMWTSRSAGCHPSPGV